MLLEDNTGAIHLMDNATVRSRSKHIDVTWHHICEMQKKGRICIIFVKSENNYADIMTKNTTEKMHKDLASGIKKGRMLCVYNAATREDVGDSGQSGVSVSDVD